MVRHAGIADGAEKDRIEQAQPVDPVFRHHPPGLGVGLAAPADFAPFEGKAIAPRRRLHDHDAFRHDLAPDAVAGDDRDPISVRHAPSSLAYSKANQARCLSLVVMAGLGPAIHETRTWVAGTRPGTTAGW